jgi:hypothetical protein
MNPLSKYLAAFEFVVAISLIGGAAFGVHKYIQSERADERKIVVAEYEKKLAEQKELATREEKRLQDQATKASEGGQQREATIRSLAAANGAAATGLLNATKAISSSLSGLSSDALRQLSIAYGDVLGECQARRGTVAEEAERLNSEKRTLIEAWPKTATRP